MTEHRLWAVRGAITLDTDTRDEIVNRTQELLRELLGRNCIERDDIVSIIFTATDDLTAEFPAAAARLMGLKGVPLLSARELSVTRETSDFALTRCVRVLMHYYGPERPHSVYLRDAARLTDDPPPHNAAP